jgi:3-deoxy-D-manno-octulosonic-acid transferase
VLSDLAWASAATLAAPFLRRHVRSRVAKGKEIAARLPEREGIDPTPRPAGPLIWLHAASVGETQSLVPVIEKIPNQIKILLTTGTVNSATLAAQRLPGVIHRFIPLDVPAWASRFLDHWHPDAAAFVESELWPNLILGAHRRGIPLLLLNARLSARSLRNWRLLPGLGRRLLQSFVLIEAQSDADAERLRRLGAPHVTSPGNLKFAAAPLPVDPIELARLRAQLGGRPVWLAASTHPGEETLVGEAHRLLAPANPHLLTILAPRHPERGAEIGAALGAPRRAAGQDPPKAAGIWIADTLGELGLLYRLAPVAFVGGSLVPRGGQNPLEAARLGCTVSIGPYTENQADAVAALEQVGALHRVADADQLASFTHSMLADPEACRQKGRAGQAAATRNDGLPEAIASKLVMAATDHGKALFAHQTLQW